MPSSSYKMTKRRAEIAETLLDLLIDHVELCDAWNLHYVRVNRKCFRKGEEEEAYSTIIRTFTAPLIARCKAEGFDYAYVSDIIPGAFVTTKTERSMLLRDLSNWAWGEFDLDQLVPF